jgi:hypothetical protein
MFTLILIALSVLAGYEPAARKGVECRLGGSILKIAFQKNVCASTLRHAGNVTAAAASLYLSLLSTLSVHPTCQWETRLRRAKGTPRSISPSFRRTRLRGRRSRLFSGPGGLSHRPSRDHARSLRPREPPAGPSRASRGQCNGRSIPESRQGTHWHLASATVATFRPAASLAFQAPPRRASSLTVTRGVGVGG